MKKCRRAVQSIKYRQASERGRGDKRRETALKSMPSKILAAVSLLYTPDWCYFSESLSLQQFGFLSGTRCFFARLMINDVLFVSWQPCVSSWRGIAPLIYLPQRFLRQSITPQEKLRGDFLLLLLLFLGTVNKSVWNNCSVK